MLSNEQSEESEPVQPKTWPSHLVPPVFFWSFSSWQSPPYYEEFQYPNSAVCPRTQWGLAVTIQLSHSCWSLKRYSNQCVKSSRALVLAVIKNGLEINSTPEVCKLCSLCRHWTISGGLWRMRQRNMSKFLQTWRHLSGQTFFFAKTNLAPTFSKNVNTHFSTIDLFFFKNENNFEENMNNFLSL